MLKEAFKDEAMGKTQVYEWFNPFKRGEMSVEDQLRSGGPSTSRSDENVEKVRQAVLEDRRPAIDEITEITGVSWSTCQRVLTEDLMMKRVAAKFVSRLLTEEP
ncbi:hypothetical protein Cfor_05006 [Coptotermes formosanus]|uniref:Mos1 transposase HTH domain-containing protein n=1 Tax=Coptotermes formosanus TaxID=36987 RepID=A0A6L2PFM2_COPFO|nr:hypothetical protein Cfor_05006 [Coptotermes formosanus]